MYQEKSGNPVLDRVGSGKASNIASFCDILEGLGMENFGIFYGHLVLLKLLVKFYCHLVYFTVIWYIFTILVCCTNKIWQPWRIGEDVCTFAGSRAHHLGSVSKNARNIKKMKQSAKKINVDSTKRKHSASDRQKNKKNTFLNKKN
jgi:hypothetical protein